MLKGFISEALHRRSLPLVVLQDCGECRDEGAQHCELGVAVQLLLPCSRPQRRNEPLSAVRTMSLVWLPATCSCQPLHTRAPKERLRNMDVQLKF